MDAIRHTYKSPVLMRDPRSIFIDLLNALCVRSICNHQSTSGIELWSADHEYGGVALVYMRLHPVFELILGFFARFRRELHVRLHACYFRSSIYGYILRLRW